MAMLKSLDVDPIEVRRAADLVDCEALVMPGGESTTMRRLLREEDFIHKLAAYGETHPVFGTCAGLILMAKEIVTESSLHLNFLDISVERNAYGRQAESFKTTLQLKFDSSPFPALFIRAPRICHCDAHVEVLATYEGEPVLVKQGHFLGATFHPELTDNSSIHAYFLKFINK